jgi:hypothetical protein
MGIGNGMAASTAGSLILILCWAAIIAVLSSQPHLDDDRGGRHFSIGIFVVGHAAFFTALGFLTANGLAGRTHRVVWWVFFLVTAFAVVDELHQAFVPGRDPSVVDLGFDAMGALLGATVFLTGTLWRRTARPASQYSRQGGKGPAALGKEHVAGTARRDVPVK